MDVDKVSIDESAVEKQRARKQKKILELRSCVKKEMDILGFPSLTVRTVSVDVKQH